MKPSDQILADIRAGREVRCFWVPHTTSNLEIETRAWEHSTLWRQFAPRAFELRNNRSR